MSKINLDELVLSPLEIEERKKLVELLLKDQEVIDWIKKNDYPVSEIENDSSYFEDYLKTRAICNSCSGLNNCRFTNRGYFQSMKYNGMLSNVLVGCRYNFDSLITHSKYIKKWDLSKKDFLNSFESMILPKSDTKYIVKVHKIRELVKNAEKGLYIYGSFGVGKTYILSCIANYFAKKKKTVSLYSVSEFASKVLTSLKSAEIKQEIMKDMKKCDILILDDIGSTRLGPWLRDDWLNDILTYRMNHEGLTFFSSNMNLDGLKELLMEKGDSQFKEVNVERLMERLEVLSTPIELIGKNWRRHGK